LALLQMRRQLLRWRWSLLLLLRWCTVGPVGVVRVSLHAWVTLHHARVHATCIRK
jgi:hypothetical protein